MDLKRSGSLSIEDRISELPDALLVQILSLIPTKHAVATCVLSKRWRSLYKMTPNLKFCYRDIDDQKTFSDNVCRFLRSHQAPVLQSLHLEMDFEDSTMDIEVMNVMMGVVFGLHVREFELQVYSCDEPYRFPTSLYKCGNGTLETWKLKFDVLVDVPLFSVCLNSLRTLCLYGVTYMDQGSIVNLLSSCSNLEKLEVMVYSDPDVKTFTIAVPSLLSLTLISNNEELDYFTDYVINAPSLKYMSLQGLTEPDSCLIVNTPELVEARVTDVCCVIYENILGFLTSVKRLSLEIASPLKLADQFNRIFNQLVYLEIQTYEPEWWILFILMLDCSPNLQLLKLIGELPSKGDRLAYKRWNQPKDVAECLVNRLETLVWKNYIGEIEDEREMAQYILRNARCLETATFSRTDIHPEKRRERLKELESVVRASKSCQLVFK